MATAAVDVEGLFRKFTVAEVKDIEKKVKADIERKKEDLRQMVGRRYRDIIEAADSINQMQQASEKILNSIRRIEQSVDRLHSVQQQLVIAGQRAKIQMRPTIDSTESLAKCAADLLELAYDAVLGEQCLESAWLFMTADYMYRMWKLNNSQQADSAASAFLEQRFRNSGRLRQKIMNIALKAISSWTSPEETVMHAVCALAFLDRANLDAALGRFLDCRKAALHGVFTNADTSSREQICSALTILQKTVLQVYQLFAPLDGPSRTMERMRLLVATPWQPALLQEYAKRQSRQLSIAVPDGIDYAKVFFMSSSTEADLTRVCELTKSWFGEALKHCGAQLSLLVHNFDTIAALTVVRENIVSSLEEASETFEWSNACQKLFGEEVSLWKSVCVAPLEGRVKELISRDVKVAFEKLAAVAVSADKGTILDRGSSIRDWWKEQRTDTIVAGTYSTLQLKARGLTMDVHRPVAELSTEVGQIDSALSAFLSNRTGETHRSFTFDDASFHETLAVACIDAVERFVLEMNEKAEGWQRMVDARSGEQEGVVSSLVKSAKLIQCFCDSAVSVRQSITRRYGLVSKVKDVDAQQDKWSTLRSSLVKSAGQLYRIWLKSALAALMPSFEQKLMLAGGDVNFWLDCAQEWEGVQIEEESEEGQKVVSTIYVPTSCSGFVSELLHSIGRCLVDVGAQSVQSDVLATLSKAVRSAILQSFEKLLHGELRQKRAIQLLFDFNVLTQMLHSAADREDATRIQRIVDRLGSFVDPFDLDVLKPHLKRNASKVLQKWQALYRIVYTPEALRTSNAPSKAAASATTETPQLVPLGVGQNRFYLLPVVNEFEKAPGTTAVGKSQQLPMSIGHEEGDKARHQTGRAQTLASTFYDKLSSSWFGSN